MDKSEEAKRYEEVMGKEALDRQLEAAKTTCRECYGRNGKHSRICRTGMRQKRRGK